MKRVKSSIGASLVSASAAAVLATMLVAGATPVSASPSHSAKAAPATNIHYHTPHVMGVNHAIKSRTRHGAAFAAASTGGNLAYNGGVNGVGVETGPNLVYLVYWGSQWNSNDPSGEANIEQSFFSNVGGSSWNNVVTQYCEGVAVGTTTCDPSATAATNPPNLLAGVWYDNSSAAPSSPTQTDLANEAINAAAYFGNTTPDSNTTVEYVINTATGNNMAGFGTQWCAWHDYVSSSYGNIAYTNMPYITDAGSSCGADNVNPDPAGATDGITLVGGHEFAETETDIYPSGGWIDSAGAEIGDKCAWVSGAGAATNVSINGVTFPVQSLWSNAAAGGAGDCAFSY